MKIISFNLNGIRSAVSKGFYDWLKTESPDILCVQEIKAQKTQIEVNKFKELGYNSIIHSAVKPGYSGVAIFSKKPADYVEIGIGIEEFDYEGRLIRADFGDFTQINSYFPSGTMGDIRQEVKYAYLDAVQNYINELKKKRPKIVLS
ncbi:MAG: exodeoxyribonuclease III, partial [Bacteroidales bacterium]|nr:exodeoxyribonuclease III [Bacteroidales bacterium]